MAELEFIIESTFSMDPIELEKMINVLILRHNHGYNQFELAFLMGFRNMYIRDVENPLGTLQYSVPNNGYMMRIFKCGIEGFVPARLPITETPIHRISTATDEDGKIHFKAEKLGDDGKWETLKTFSEEPKKLLLPSPSIVSEEKVVDWVARKFDGGRFFVKPKTALEILHACEKDMDGPVRPIFLASALKKHTAKKKAPRLLKPTNEVGRFVFVRE